MADANTLKLCTQIITSSFGQLTGKAAHALLSHGRLSLPQLAKFAVLRPRTARLCVLVLIQHNLVWHTLSDGEGEMMELNVEECLLRLRYGRFVWQTEQLFGTPGCQIISLILDHGKLKPPDIMNALTEGMGDDKSEYNKTLQKLIAGAYIVPSTVLAHASPHDKLMQYDAEERKLIKNIPTARELREARARAEARLKREQEAAMKVGMVEESFFRVNSAKYNIHIRNMLIEKVVRERFNDAAACVMRAVLKSTEAKQLSVSDVRSDPTTMANISTQLAESDNLRSGLAYPSGHKPSVMNALKDLLGILSVADNPTPSGRAGSFLSFAGTSTSKVTVEFELICRRIRRRVFEAVVREGYGDEGVRIVRLLLDTGKMNGDQLGKVAMMSANTVRTLLTAMSEESLVSIQEVPKGADRNPQRTYYLWFVDLKKAYSVILGKMYKTLYNISMRRDAEQQEASVKAVLEKCERSDVQQDASLLTRVERDILRGWEETREKLSVLEMRVEEAVFVLRDLAVLGIDDD